MSDQASEDQDDAFIRELRGVFARVDAVPPHVTEGARAAIEFRDIDARIAELLRDSAVEDKELAGVRGAAQRLLSFQCDDAFVEVDVDGAGEYRDLVGYVVPAVEGALQVQGADGLRDVEVDAQGRFRVTRIAGGPMRLLVRLAERPGFVTPWLTI